MKETCYREEEFRDLADLKIVNAFIRRHREPPEDVHQGLGGLLRAAPSANRGEQLHELIAFHAGSHKPFESFHQRIHLPGRAFGVHVVFFHL